MKPKPIFFFGYSNNCFLKLSKNNNWLKVELVVSYTKFEKNYRHTTCADVYSELKQFCKQHTGFTPRKRTLSKASAKELLDKLEEKQLTLFSR